MTRRAIVIGGGIMGLSAAWALRADGFAVTLFEQGPLPNPLGSSVDQHRLIRFTYGAQLGYTAMVAAAYEAWEQVWEALGARHYAATGTLALAGPDRDWLANSRRSFETLGIEHETLAAAEMARRWPTLVAGDIEEALWTASGGVLFAEDIVAGLAAYLRKQEVSLRCNSPVVSLDVERASATLADGSTHGADVLVIATGPWVARLLPELAARVTPSRQIVVYLDVPSDAVAHWARAPMVLELDPDRGWYLVPSDNGRAVKIGDHRFSLSGNPDRDREAGAAESEALAALAQARLADFARYRIRESKTCFYTVQPEERFIVEPVTPRSWVMTGFSGHGFKFGALMGLKLADGVSDRIPAGALSAWARGEERAPFDDSPSLLESRQ